MTISFMPSVTANVVSIGTTKSMSPGKRFFSSANSFLTPSAVATALEPGN